MTENIVRDEIIKIADRVSFHNVFNLYHESSFIYVFEEIVVVPKRKRSKNLKLDF